MERGVLGCVSVYMGVYMCVHVCTCVYGCVCGGTCAESEGSHCSTANLFNVAAIRA